MSFEKDLFALHQKPSKKNSAGHKTVERYKAEMEAAARRRELGGIAFNEIEKVVISFYSVVSNVRTFYFQPSKKKKNSEEDMPAVKVVISCYIIES